MRPYSLHVLSDFYPNELSIRLSFKELVPALEQEYWPLKWWKITNFHMCTSVIIYNLICTNLVYKIFKYDLIFIKLHQILNSKKIWFHLLNQPDCITYKYTGWILHEWSFNRGVTIHLPHDTIRIVILTSRYDTYCDTFNQTDRLTHT